MELRIEREALGKELSIISRAAGKKAVIQAYNYVHIVAEPMQPLRLETTDGTIAIKSTALSATIDKSGEAMVPALRLLEIVKAMVGPEVSIKADGAGPVKIACGGFKSNLATLAAEDFPKLPDPEGAHVVLDAKAVGRLIRQVRYACTGADDRFFLNGAQISGKDGMVRLAATDAHRLAVSSWKSASEIPAMLIPSFTMDALAALLESSPVSDTTYVQAENHIFFIAGNRILASRRMDGNFPAYERIIPKSYTASCSVNRSLLQAALKRVMLVQSQTVRAVNITMSDGGVRLDLQTVEVGEADEMVEAKHTGPELKVRVQGAYLDDALDVAASETVLLESEGGDTRPLVIRDGEEALSVIMPMR